MRQELMWIPKAVDKGAFVPQAPLVPFPYKIQPKRVWTLVMERDFDKPPQLPFKPVHLNGTFLEDAGHDWNIKKKDGKKYFSYASRVMTGQVWLLLEWEE